MGDGPHGELPGIAATEGSVYRLHKRDERKRRVVVLGQCSFSACRPLDIRSPTAEKISSSHLFLGPARFLRKILHALRDPLGEVVDPAQGFDEFRLKPERIEPMGLVGGETPVQV